MEIDKTQTDFNQQQANGILCGAMLSKSGSESSRREQIAAQFISALISSGGYPTIGSSSWDEVANNLVESAILLTDKLILRLEKDKYFPKFSREEKEE